MDKLMIKLMEEIDTHRRVYEMAGKSIPVFRMLANEFYVFKNNIGHQLPISISKIDEEDFMASEFMGVKIILVHPERKSSRSLARDMIYELERIRNLVDKNINDLTQL